MDNYMESVKETTSQLMKPGFVHKILECQQDKRNLTSNTVTQPYSVINRKDAIEERDKEIEIKKRKHEKKHSKTKCKLEEKHSAIKHKLKEKVLQMSPSGVSQSLGHRRNKQTCDVSAVKRESWLPQFCHGCFSVDRALAPLDELLDLYCSLLENKDVPVGPVVLCWECGARLRRVGEFRARAAAVQTYLRQHRTDQAAPLPAPLSRLCVARNNVECEAKPAELILMEVGEVKHEAPELLLPAAIEVKQEIKEDDTQTWQTEDLVSNATLWDSRPPRNSEKGPKRNNRKYVYIDNTDLRLEKFCRKVPINGTELAALLEKERIDELFLGFPYRCDSCVRGWTHERALRTHNLKRHSQSSPYQCDICAVRIATKPRLSFHIKAHYLARQCVACGFRCASLGAMRRHVLAQHHKTVQCRACGACFHDTRTFRRHWLALHQHFECDHCGKRRLSRAAIERHLARHGPFPCGACNLTLNSRASLARHSRRHAPAPERAYCVECDKQFTTVACYRTHLAEARVHTDSGRARPACPVCGKTFARLAYMRAHHSFVHLARPKYTCAQCDKSFGGSSQYNFHMRRHQPGYEPRRDKLCTVCGRGFATNWHLANHLRTHTGERPFACELCAARFGAAVALRAHVDFVHLKRQRGKTRRASAVTPTE